MIIGGIVVAVVLAAFTVALLTRRAAHDDLHSVEGYHRSIHTLESINAHPAAPAAGAQSSSAMKSAFPESAVRVGGGTHSVRVTDAPPASLPPVPPPPMLDPEAPVSFDDTEPPPASSPPHSPSAQSPSSMPSHDVPGSRDKAMVSINHRPRRLAAPAAAVAGVIVLVAVLLLTGTHSVAPSHHHHTASTKKSVTKPAPTTLGSQTTSPTTAPPPTVALPQSSTSSTATYVESAGTFSLSFAATSGPCWVDATNSTTGATVFAGTLQPGKNQAVNVTGPLTVIIGAPSVLAVAVNGSPVALPSGFETPFTMMFVTPS
jgi:Domain of unknown function (DUF4115)